MLRELSFPLRVSLNKFFSVGILNFGSISHVDNYIDLARAKREALVNIYSLLKQNIKSCNAKRRRQRKRQKKINTGRLKLEKKTTTTTTATTLHVQHTFVHIS